MSFDLSFLQKIDMTFIENMIPWERDLFIDQLRQHIEQENLKYMQAKASNGRRF
jgi:hypothetical protein